MIGARLSIRAIGLVSTIVLARLLQPADFGVISLSMALVTAMDVFSNFTFDMALIRQPDARREHYDTVWTLTIIRGALITLALIALARPAAIFFAEPRIEPIVYWLGASALLEGFQNVGIVDFRKELAFHREFLFQIYAKLTGFVVTVVLAVAWQNFWALVAGIIAYRAAALVLSYVMHPYRPRFSLTEWRNLFSFSAWLLFSNISYFLGARLDTFVIGRLLNVHILGIYEISSEIASLPTGELVAPIHRALYPGYAKMLQDPARLAQGYISGLAVMLMIALPAAAGVGCVAEPIIRVFLGEKWLEALPLLQILAIGGMVRVWYANSLPVLLAMGRAKLLSHLAILNLAIAAVFIVVGTLTEGAIGTAIAIVASTAISSAMYVGVTLKLLSASLDRLLSAVWRTLVSVAVMAVAVEALSWMWSSLERPPPAFLQLISAVTLGVISYVGVHFALWRLVGSPDGAEADSLRALGPTLMRLRGAIGFGS
jgi:lipopolysaccharide exporter